MFGNVRQAFGTILEILGILRNVVGNLRKIVKSVAISMFIQQTKYYMPVYGYEFYTLVFNSISHSFAALTRYRVEHLKIT